MKTLCHLLRCHACHGRRRPRAPYRPGGERARGRRPAGPKRISRHLPLSPWLFAAPGLLVVGAFSLYPFFSTLVNAFTDRRTLVPGTFVGLDNFQELLHDEMSGSAFQQQPLRPRRRTRARDTSAAARDVVAAAHPRHHLLPLRLLHPRCGLHRRRRPDLGVDAGRPRADQLPCWRPWASARSASSATRVAAAAERDDGHGLEGPRLLHDHLSGGPGERSTGAA